jgi:predicted RNase H-like HicB family nuclease
VDITVLLEPLDSRAFRATSLLPTRLVAEGATRDEALDRLRKLVQVHFGQGELVQIQVPLPGEPHPWKALAGTLKDHPDFDEFVENMAEYRRQVDADPNRP